MSAKKAKKPLRGQNGTEKAGKGNAGEQGFRVLLTLLFFLAVCLSADSNIKGLCLLLSLGCVVLGALRFRRLKGRLRLPLLALMLLLIMGGASTLYASAGKPALQEYMKLLAGFSAAMCLMLAFAGKKEPARETAGVLSAAAALCALLSIDLLSTRLLSGAVLGLLELLEPRYGGLAGVEAGVRLTSIFDNPNIFAGCAGIGVLLSLGLASTAEGRGEKRWRHFCLYICSLAFVLAFSMGAVASIAAAFALYLLLERRGRRSALFLLMLETLLLCALAAGLCSLTALDAWDGFMPLPLLCAVLGSALLCLLQEKTGGLEQWLGSRGRAAAMGAGALVLLLAAYAAAALSMTGPASLSAGESLSRAAYPEPGEYSLRAEGGGGLSINIFSQSREDTMMHTRQELYSGSLEGAAFTVPEDSVVVYFRIGAAQDTVLESLEYVSAGDSGRVKLSYRLLPDFVANRLQGLKANQNATQRLVFFSDGMKLFSRSPIFGLGMGSFETCVQSVQSFHYETKYVHNHYIQTLLETGILGLAIFLGLLLVCALSIIRRRRSPDCHPLVPCLGAVLAFMALHGAVEVVFSAHCYLPFAMGAFLLINECCGAECLPSLPEQGRSRGIAAAVMGVFVLGYSLLLGLNMIAGSSARSDPDYDSFRTAAAIDAFEWGDYALSYVMQAAGDKNAPPAVLEQAEKFAQRLEKGESNTRFYYLADYYFAMDNEEKAMDMALRHVQSVISNSREWNATVELIRLHDPSGEQFRRDFAQLMELMESWNSENMGEIILDEDERAYADSVLGR